MSKAKQTRLLTSLCRKSNTKASEKFLCECVATISQTTEKKFKKATVKNSENKHYFSELPSF